MVIIGLLGLLILLYILGKVLIHEVENDGEPDIIIITFILILILGATVVTLLAGGL